MNIAIIGSGNVGGALARSSTRARHTVTISSTNRAEAEQVAQSTGATVAGSNAEAARSADITILAVPADTVADVAAELGEAIDGRTVIDVTNRPTPGPDIGRCTSVAEEVQARVPNAHVVKAINTVFAARQADPEIDGMHADGYVAGNDEDAKKLVLEYVQSIGLRPFDVGPLAAARTLEGMGWIHISLAMKNNWPWQSAWKIVGPTD